MNRTPHWIVGISSLVALTLASGCTADDKPAPPIKEDVAALAKANNEFAFDLYKKLAEKDGNVFFSPYSISAALGMTYAGARGETAEEMAKVLRIAALADRVHPAQADLAGQLRSAGGKDRPEFHIANALWGQRGVPFRPEFLELTKRHYAGGFRELDFAGDADGSRRTINGWIGEQTCHKIPELLKPRVLTPETKLVLTNAIYFKGAWAHPFDPKATREGDFFRTPTDPVKVSMMKQTADLRYAEVGDARVLELPYAGGEFSMVVVLPKRAEDMGRVEAAIAGGALDGWLAKAVEREVVVTLPKFRLRAAVDLKQTLKQLGMVKAFDDADFSGLTGSGDLRITKVVHEALIDVDEKGTEAAGATAVAVQPPSDRLHVEFRVDQPFLFVIRDRKNGPILFLGRVVKPD